MIPSLFAHLFSRKPAQPPAEPVRYGDYRDISRRNVRRDPETKQPVWPITGVPS
jgi:hypothetical protein